MTPSLPPGPRDWTMGLWTARQMATNVFAFFRGLQRDYGDIVHLRPGIEHHVVNDNDQDFEFYAIWWDAEMSKRSLARYEAMS